MPTSSWTESATASTSLTTIQPSLPQLTTAAQQLTPAIAAWTDPRCISASRVIGQRLLRPEEEVAIRQRRRRHSQAASGLASGQDRLG
jgi:hypothetical protein